MPTSPGSIDPLDPVFISYRQADGTPTTLELAWLLRAAGIPVWRDRDDLPPGDTDQRLAEAIDAGISGAVFVITPEITASRIVKTIEAPRIVGLHTADSQFALSIANSVRTQAGKLDYAAPDTLLELDPPVLVGVDQKESSRLGLLEITSQMIFHRIAAIRPQVQAEGNVFKLSIQTRNTPQVYDRTDSHLDIRVRPSSHEKLPDSAGLVDLKDTIHLLPDSVTRADSRKVRITGGAHISVALALGASLPSSRVGEVEVIDQRDAIWASGSEAQFQAEGALHVVQSVARPNAHGTGRPKVAIYIDLMQSQSNAAFDSFVVNEGAAFEEWTQVELVENGLIDPSNAGVLAAEVAAHMRDLSNRNSNAEVHVLYRGPFPLAVLIGRLTNTMRLVAYEWDDSDPEPGQSWGPRYVAAIRLRASDANGAIQEVLI